MPTTAHRQAINATFADQVRALLLKVRRVSLTSVLEYGEGQQGFVQILRSLSRALLVNDFPREAEAISQALDRSTEDKVHGGLGISNFDTILPGLQDKILFQVEAFLEALNSEDKARKLLQPLSARPKDRMPMTLSQKILAHHAIGPVPPEGLSVGDLVRLSIDWVISSELAWEMLRRLMDKAGAGAVFRNDRLWLAGDHRVDPKNYDTPTSKQMTEAMQKAEREFKLTEFKGNNYTIIHTEFVRERAEPGSLVIGADSRMYLDNFFFPWPSPCFQLTWYD